MTRAISLFSGIGGGELALEMAGVTTLAMCEKDVFCQEILSSRFPNTQLFEDVTTFDSKVFGDIDILLTTFPCQAVSVAGKQLGEKDERWLWKENLKFIRNNRPIFVIGENVKGLLTKGLQGIEDDLRGEGYQVRSYVLAAKDIGAIHQRERVFIIGYKPRRQTAHTPSNGRNGEQRGASNTQADEWSEKGTNQDECFERCGKVRAVLQPRKPTESWRTLPKFRGVDDGLPLRLDKVEKQRIKALGNSVVPQQIYPFILACTTQVVYDICKEFNINSDDTIPTITRRLKRKGWSDKDIAIFKKSWVVVKNNK